MLSLVALTEGQKADALSPLNRYFTWIALGYPHREVSDEEAMLHYLDTFVPRPAFAYEVYKEGCGCDPENPLFI